jgi:hypothetical protein
MTETIIQYKMKSDLFNLEELKKDPDFSVKRLGDAVYMGIIKDGKREGKGIMRYKNRLYEGSWENDLRHGEGFEVYKNNNYYLGGFQNGKFSFLINSLMFVYKISHTDFTLRAYK